MTQTGHCLLSRATRNPDDLKRLLFHAMLNARLTWCFPDAKISETTDKRFQMNENAMEE
jgi:hypothetical protein